MTGVPDFRVGDALERIATALEELLAMAKEDMEEQKSK